MKHAPISYINFAEINREKDKIAYVGKNGKMCSYKKIYKDN